MSRGAWLVTVHGAAKSWTWLSDWTVSFSSHVTDLSWMNFVCICLCYLVNKPGPFFCDPMDCRAPCFPVLHYLPQFAQTHVHWVGDAIQQSHLLSPPSLALNFSQHQDLFQSQLPAWGGQSIGVSASASVLPINIQHWFPLGLTGLISLQPKGLSRVFFRTSIQKH